MSGPLGCLIMKFVASFVTLAAATKRCLANPPPPHTHAFGCYIPLLLVHMPKISWTPCKYITLMEFCQGYAYILRASRRTVPVTLWASFLLIYREYVKFLAGANCTASKLMGCCI